jgi:predicted signal transduction protein with EAL and GGDEF domain
MAPARLPGAAFAALADVLEADADRVVDHLSGRSPGGPNVKP